MDKNILPFWEIIPRFFLIPLKGVGIIALLLLSSLVSLFPLKLIYIMVFFAVIKYGMEILGRTAEGHLSAPMLTLKVLNENYELPFKLIALLLLPLAILWKLGDDSPFLSLFLIVFYSMVLPASIMTLTYTRHFFYAINPFELLRLISRLGFSYIILYIFLFFLSGAAPIAYIFFIGSVIESSFFFTVLFQVYFFWVMFGMMGYVLYQHHEDIGYELPNEREQRLNRKQDPLFDLNTFIENEDFIAAQRELKALILRNPEDLSLRARFHKLVKISGNIEELTSQGSGMIWRLIAKNKLFDAVNIYLDCIKVAADFKPYNESDYLPLAEEMRRMRLYKEAISLGNNFHNHYPNSTQIPFLYLLMVKIFIEDLSQNDNAGTMISFLKSNYKGHDIEAELDSYNKLLTRI